MDLGIRHGQQGRYAVVFVSGDVDLATLPRFADALARTVAPTSDTRPTASADSIASTGSTGSTGSADATDSMDSTTDSTVGHAGVAVDLSDVVVLDDAALGLLLGAAARARSSGRELVVVTASEAMRRRLRLTRFDRAVDVRAQLDAP
jgi:anti-anti-sigma factor